MLRVYDQPDLDSFPPGLWGIREPPREKDGKPRPNGNHPFPPPVPPALTPLPQLSTPINSWISYSCQVSAWPGWNARVVVTKIVPHPPRHRR